MMSKNPSRRLGAPPQGEGGWYMNMNSRVNLILRSAQSVRLEGSLTPFRYFSASV